MCAKNTDSFFFWMHRKIFSSLWYSLLRPCDRVWPMDIGRSGACHFQVWTSILLWFLHAYPLFDYQAEAEDTVEESRCHQSHTMKWKVSAGLWSWVLTVAQVRHRVWNSCLLHEDTKNVGWFILAVSICWLMHTGFR